MICELFNLSKTRWMIHGSYHRSGLSGQDRNDSGQVRIGTIPVRIGKSLGQDRNESRRERGKPGVVYSRRINTQTYMEKLSNNTYTVQKSFSDIRRFPFFVKYENEKEEIQSVISRNHMDSTN